MLKGRRAVVTGSTSGIGLGIARALAAEGCSLLLNGFGRADKIEALRAEISGRFGVEVFFHGADLTRMEECEALIREAQSRMGGVDVLVNNAGIQHVAPVESFPVEEWDRILAVNLTAAFHTVRMALPGMRRLGWGRILNIASAHGLVGSAQKSAYVAAKHGLVGFTKVVALETAGSGVTCNAVCPGWVRTPLVEEQIGRIAQAGGIENAEAAWRLLREKQPSGKFTTVEQIGAMAVFLCSEGAANITGSSMMVDGGWTAQ